MITIENIESGTIYEGQEIEYFLDDENMIGEIYLDGNLIYQSTDASSEKQLELEFRKEFVLDESIEIPEDFMS
jgi:hypothetical protein